MPVNSTVEVVGLKQTINGLGKIDKQLQKDFKTDATQIAQPAINAAKAVYTKVPLSGMNRKWQQEGRTRANFPFVVSKAKNGVKMRFDTRRNAVGVILIEQKQPSAGVVAHWKGSRLPRQCASMVPQGFGCGISHSG